MLENIQDWNPQQDYSDYPIGEMYNMDFVARWLIENKYEPKTLSLKDYVLNIMEWIEFWNNHTYREKWILVCNKGVVDDFFKTHKCESFEANGRWGIFENYIKNTN